MKKFTKNLYSCTTNGNASKNGINVRWILKNGNVIVVALFETKCGVLQCRLLSHDQFPLEQCHIYIQMVQVQFIENGCLFACHVQF